MTQSCTIISLSPWPRVFDISAKLFMRSGVSHCAPDEQPTLPTASKNKQRLRNVDRSHWYHVVLSHASLVKKLLTAVGREIKATNRDTEIDQSETSKFCPIQFCFQMPVLHRQVRYTVLHKLVRSTQQRNACEFLFVITTACESESQTVCQPRSLQIEKD